METHLARFRIEPAVKPDDEITEDTQTPTTSPQAIPISQGAKKILACERCRTHRKKCSKTPPKCGTCAAAGTACSLATPPTSEVDHLRARLAWMEDFINERNILGRNQPIGQITTGINLSDIANQTLLSATSQLSPPSSVALVVSPNTNTQLDVTPVERTDDGSSPKRRRLDIEADAPSDAHRYVEAYFTDTNRAYPFIDRDRVLAILEARGDEILQNPQADEDSTTLYLVMAIGSTSLVRAGDTSTAHTTFEIHCEDVMWDCVRKNTIESVHTLMLLAIYSLTDSQGFSVPAIINALAQQATRLGLHRREMADQGISSTEAEKRHRFFWSLYNLDRMHVADTGLPPAFRCADANIPLPGLTVDEFTSPKRQEFTTMLQVCRHIIQLRQLEEKVLQQIHFRDQRSQNISTPADCKEMVINLRTEIEDWYSNGCLLKSSETKGSIHITVAWLGSRYYNLLLFLYYPSSSSSAKWLISKEELMSIAQNYIKSNAFRYQQRKLPLNEPTLCRLFLVCMVFLHCFLSQTATEALINAKEEMTACVDVLASYPSEWLKAHRAASVLKQLISLIESLSASPPESQSVQAWTLSQADRAWCHTIRLNMLELSNEIFGKGSVYTSPHYLEDDCYARIYRENDRYNLNVGRVGYSDLLFPV